MNNYLRIGFLISETKKLPEWETEMIIAVKGIPGIRIAALICVEPKRDYKKGLGLRAFQKFENLWFRSTSDASRKISIDTRFGEIPVIEAANRDTLRGLDLDIIYCTDGVQRINEFENLARYGVWYITFGSGQYTAAVPPGYWEVMHDCAEIASCLQVKRPDTPAITIYEGSTTTVPYSVKNTYSHIAWKSASYLPLRLNEFLKTGASSFFSREKYKEPDSAPSKYTTPGTLTAIGLFIRNTFRYLRYKITFLSRHKKFTILYSEQAFRFEEFDLNRFIPLTLPGPGGSVRRQKNFFRADPFLIVKDQKAYIFFEEFHESINKGHISVVMLSKKGQHSEPIKILDRPYHISYPFIFQYQDDYYMIPETSANKTVELYKCRSFPHEWDFVENLMTGIVLIDPTLLYYNKRWWLFGTRPEPSFTSTNDQLFLYSSETILSPRWDPHPQNPVVTNISNCRPAGCIFSRNGKFYRPAQNNASKQYGYAIKINEIEVLSETEYKEKEVFEILPDSKNLCALHTLNFTDDLIVIDGIV